MGYDIVKEYLDYDTVSSGSYEYVDLKYRPSNININSGSTNITAGFQAAKDAFKTARYPKKQQFIIFFSDGVATYPGQQGSPEANQYIEDVKADIPTTFTIYFTQDPNPPQDLVDMTDNIKVNNYSIMNKNSALWAIDLGQQTLMTFLVENVLTIITGTIVSNPIDITIDGATVSNYDTIGGVFNFNSLFPLTGELTEFEYDINYKIAKQVIVWDTANQEWDTTIVQSDSSTEGSFEIQVVDGADLPDSGYFPDKFTMDCWERELKFFNGNTEIFVANETMNNLEVRFMYDSGDAGYKYSNVLVDLTTTEGNAQDKETVTLSENGPYFFREFPQAILADNQNPTQGDGIVQHYAFDSLIATFRNKENPELPLDTLRYGIPFRLNGYIQSQAAYYYDRTADGYVDSIVVKITTDLDDGLTDEHLKEIMDSGLITLPVFRGFTIESYRLVQDGFALLVTENTGHEQVTYIRDDDSIKVSSKILSVGGWVEATTIAIYDKVAPILMRRSKGFQGTNYLTPLLVDFQDTVADTLFIDFSEPVKNISDNVPFYFLNVDSNVEFTANLDLVEITTTSAKFTVNMINGTKIKSFHTGDSVWIFDDDRVADICEDESGNVANNYQNNLDNIKRLLTVTFIAIDLNLNPITISPINLNDINNDSSIIIIPDELVQIFQDSGMIDIWNLVTNDNGDPIGMVIQIIPDFGDKDTNSFEKMVLEGDISIFDAVGNMIVDREPMLFINDPSLKKLYKTLNFAWSAKNTLGRFVGSGSYLAVADIKKWPMGKSGGGYEILAKRIMIAVQD